ncbi:type II toxin-antitoxin system Phd/YefM family antitoxin [Rhizobium rhizophilum]|uniref:type II toxin-antitoxin system Phd/YefM family antitoxin n=1 Tax=Rhizobium rhizophilum TaxID=1850373 RepID=UPI002E259607
MSGVFYVRTVTTVEIMRHFGRYPDEAKESPITSTKHGRPSVVVLPVELFEKLKAVRILAACSRREKCLKSWQRCS